MHIKEDKIGTIFHSKTHGFAIKIGHEHTGLLIKEERFDLLDSSGGDLKPLGDMKVSELREIAKEMDGYQSKMRKPQLIKLIQNDLPKSK